MITQRRRAKSIVAAIFLPFISVAILLYLSSLMRIPAIFTGVSTGTITNKVTSTYGATRKLISPSSSIVAYMVDGKGYTTYTSAAFFGPGVGSTVQVHYDPTRPANSKVSPSLTQLSRLAGLYIAPLIIVAVFVWKRLG